MNSQPSPRRSGFFGRPVLTVTIVLAVLVGAGVGSVAFASRNADNRSVWHSSGPVASAITAASVSPSVEPDEDRNITLSATGDIMMSNAPTRMPVNDGDGFFAGIRDSLTRDIDLAMGNLEQPLTADTGTTKCGSPPGPNCYAFRSPPSYARHLKAAGFQLMNLANNHTRDFGVAGARNTRTALDKAGVRYTGNPGEITVVEVNGIKIAVVGFSTYSGANNLNDLDASKAVVARAKEQADLVVVQAHMGAEGTDRQHVKPGNETFHGEDRGNPIKFTHAVIDAGADLVIGHGPHVLRGMEFYKGKLIAYSLGNFCGGGNTLKATGVLRYGGVLRVELTPDGEFADGRFVPTAMNADGRPVGDDVEGNGVKLTSTLSSADFPGTGARIDEDGVITPPA